MKRRSTDEGAPRAAVASPPVAVGGAPSSVGLRRSSTEAGLLCEGDGPHRGAVNWWRRHDPKECVYSVVLCDGCHAALEGCGVDLRPETWAVHDG